MIRITCKNESSATRLFLEGKLTGTAVEELDKCWQSSLAIPTAFSVDLTNITFIDDHGKELLMKMHHHGAQLVSRSLMTKCLIREIKQAVRKN